MECSEGAGREAALGDVRGALFAEVNGRFDLQAAAFRAAAERLDPKTAGAALLLEALELYGRATDSAKTLLTIARAHAALNAADGFAAAERSRVARALRGIDTAAAPLLRALLDGEAAPLPESGRRLYAAWRLEAEARDAEGALGGGSPKGKDLRNFADALRTDVFEPLLAMHTHLTSTMSIEVSTSEGALRAQSFGTSVAVLKSSDDPVLRRSTFEGMNSWMAQHASSFADLLNAVTGFRLQRSAISTDGGDPLRALYGSAFRRERTSVEVFGAMMEAIDEVLEPLRSAVRLRAQALGRGPMRVAHLLCPRPEERYQPGLSYEAMRGDWRRTFEPTAPGFADFVVRAHDAGWVNSESLSMKAGGGWCDDLPAIGAVRIVASHFPNRTGEAQLTHLLGVGWLHDVLHGQSAPERLVPLSIRELAGNVCETLFVRRLLEACPEAADSLRWLMLQRLTNLLLTIPARHRLLGAIYRERRSGVLPATVLNALSDESWRHYYGDSTLETDRYVWVHKPHFYRHGTVFYDWQYAFGFLLSQLLVRRWLAEGRTASGATLEDLWRDAGSMRTEELVARHVGGDPRSVDFWRAALEEALRPVEAFRNRAAEARGAPVGGRSSTAHSGF